MSGQAGHPDTHTLADFQAGLIGGMRGKRLAAHLSQCAECVSATQGLDLVTEALRRAPVPSIPDAAERRITAAIAAEATVRETSPQPVRRPRPIWSRRVALYPRSVRVPVGALVSTAACLLLIIISFAVTGGPSAAPSAAPPAAGTGKASPRVQGGSPRFSGRNGDALESAPFVIASTGTSFRKATLAAQVRQLLATRTSPPAVPLQGPSSGSVPSRPLVDCVMHVTGNIRPSVVDLATYQSRAAYVIATSDRAWVVGLHCTAAHPGLIASVRFAPVR